MQTTTQTAQAAPAPRRGRFVWLFLALLLQVGFIWALMAGLTLQGVINHIDPFRYVDIPPAVKPAQPPPAGPMQQPKVDKVVQPDIIIDEGRGPGEDNKITLNGRPDGQTGPADHGPVSIAFTHTTPPYPPLDQRLGHEGTVVLRLMIAPDGRVIDAVVVRSSGYETLDGAARAWVIGHWRYQPAIRGGAAVAGTTTVGVRFNLRNGG